MPTLEEILERVGSCSVLTKLDLAKGYYQVKVDELSKEYTAFISPFGKFQFTRMPFGLKNAPAVFQRLMDSVLSPCYGFSAPYMDFFDFFKELGGAFGSCESSVRRTEESWVNSQTLQV